MKILQINMDHFNSDRCASLTCLAGHTSSMLEAISAAATKISLLEKQSKFDRSLAMNAFADHFLLDMFASGHIRTPRHHLLKICEGVNSGAVKLASAGLAAGRGHDEDNWNGLEVLAPMDVITWQTEVAAAIKKEGKGDFSELAFETQKLLLARIWRQKWLAYGDHRLYDDNARLSPSSYALLKKWNMTAPYSEQFYRLQEVVQASIDDIKWVYQETSTGKLNAKQTAVIQARAAAVMKYVPDILLSTTFIPFYYARNTCPLYHIEFTGPKIEYSDNVEEMATIEREIQQIYIRQNAGLGGVSCAVPTFATRC
jgi:hypothetical protein